MVVVDARSQASEAPRTAHFRCRLSYLTDVPASVGPGEAWGYERVQAGGHRAVGHIRQLRGENRFSRRLSSLGSTITVRHPKGISRTL